MDKKEIILFIFIILFIGILLGWFIWGGYHNPNLTVPCSGELTKIEMEFYENGRLKKYVCN